MILVKGTRCRESWTYGQSCCEGNRKCSINSQPYTRSSIPFYRKIRSISISFQHLVHNESLHRVEEGFPFWPVWLTRMFRNQVSPRMLLILCLGNPWGHATPPKMTKGKGVRVKNTSTLFYDVIFPRFLFVSVQLLQIELLKINMIRISVPWILQKNLDQKNIQIDWRSSWDTAPEQNLCCMSHNFRVSWCTHRN